MRRVVFLIVPYIISRMFDKEVDIEDEKVDIENKKWTLVNEICAI